MSKGQYGVNKKRFVIKLIIAVLFLVSLYEIISSSIADAEWEAEYHSKGSMVRQCDERYYDRNFSGLLWYLKLYDLYDDDYDMYWESVNAYNDYLSWHAWKGALDSGEMPGAAQKEAEARIKVEENAINCKFSQNQKILDGFAAAIKTE